MAQEFYKKIYTHREFYQATVWAIRSLKHLVAARRHKLLSAHQIERIMLAVTEVNGCEVCSYAHTQMALEQGMSSEEIRNILAGDTSDLPESDAVAVFFAQHYADQRGKPSAESWQRLIDQYGEASARGILAAARIMTVANIHGIAISALARRFQGKPVAKTGLAYELSITAAILLYLPLALLHALLADLRREPLLLF
ncbi:MAG: carboxymuconolactone decarboxylase family protein [Clostridia bacterium]|nr:carboxymuconolactone decarboxylase family protein [Clostridia bacterium]